MHQADDFGAECQSLKALLNDIEGADYDRPTAFKDWTANDVLVHLHFWNSAADMSLSDADALMALIGQVTQSGNMRAFENQHVKQRGRELLAEWFALSQDMAERWNKLDPKMRVKWAGPDMSVRSSITARQMEHWAHGQELFDLFGEDREETDRVRNIVVLGVNTFGWTFKVRGQEPPGDMPALALTAPSGEVWEYGESRSDKIEGSAVEFCRVVTQTRNVADTSLKVSGDAATLWMANAQCFAGPPETPPAPGTRSKSTG